MAMIGKVKRMHSRQNKSVRKIARIASLSRNTVRKWLKSPVEGEPKYRRGEQPRKLTAFHEAIKQALKVDASCHKHERRTARALYAEIKVAGYSGGYRRVTDFIREWRQGEGQGCRRLPSCRWCLSLAKRSSSTGATRGWWWAASITACRWPTPSCARAVRSGWWPIQPGSRDGTCSRGTCQSGTDLAYFGDGDR